MDLYVKYIMIGAVRTSVSWISQFKIIVTYSGLVWLITMGSGLNDGIYWYFYYNYDRFCRLTISGCLRLAPFLTGLHVSCLLLWRMTNEQSLLTESLDSLKNANWLNSPDWTNFQAGRAIAQAVSRLLHTATARVRAHVRSCGVFGGQSGTGEGFLLVFRFPLPILIPLTAPHSKYAIRGWCNRPVSGRRTKWVSLAPSQETKKNFQANRI
jgi:hypothetical protein